MSIYPLKDIHLNIHAREENTVVADEVVGTKVKDIYRVYIYIYIYIYTYIYICMYKGFSQTVFSYVIFNIPIILTMHYKNMLL